MWIEQSHSDVVCSTPPSVKGKKYPDADDSLQVICALCPSPAFVPSLKRVKKHH